jgi:hypothetical protein
VGRVEAGGGIEDNRSEFLPMQRARQFDFLCVAVAVRAFARQASFNQIEQPLIIGEDCKSQWLPREEMAIFCLQKWSTR